MQYIIEHLEEEVYEWCKLEYEHICSEVGKENLIITNLGSRKNCDAFSKFGTCHEQSIKQLAKTEFKGKKLCLLDSSAKDTLKPEDSKAFDFLVLGGILGDHPPKQRTMKELGSLKLDVRNLGSEQMPTDTAVIVSDRIMHGKKFSELKFMDGIEIDIAEGEAIQFPFRYLVENGKPSISAKLVKYLKEHDGF